MASTAVKKQFTNQEEILLPTYKKLPPIPNSQKVPARQVISPTSVSVELYPQGSAQSKQLTGGKVSPRKMSADSTKSVPSKSVSSQNGLIKRASPLGSGGKSGMKVSGNVASDQSNNGIELIGYRMTNGQPASSSAKVPVPQQASDWTPLSSELPPCRICGDKASGLHYGVNTCEACKAFFRRTLKKSTVNFDCTCSPEEKKLGTDKPRKTTCPKCRYERCIKVGMSKDAIKIGRYTISRKRQNDKEVKTLKKGEKTPASVGNRRISESSKSTSSSSPYSTSQSVSSPEELSSDITSLSLQEKKTMRSAKKRRHDDEDGLLYQSLTNSIFLSLVENQFSAPAADDKNLSPMEQLLTSDGNAESGLTPMEQLLVANQDFNASSHQPDLESDLSAVERLLETDTAEEEAFSPLAHILSTLDHTSEEISPIEQLLAQPTVSDTSNQILDGGRNENIFSDQNQTGRIEMHSGDLGLEIVADNSTDAALSATTLFGIYDGSGINSKVSGSEQIHDIKTTEESPIENLLKAPIQSLPYLNAFPGSDVMSENTHNENVSNLIHDESQQYPLVPNGHAQDIPFQDNFFQNEFDNTNVLNRVVESQPEVNDLPASNFNVNEEVNNADNECEFASGDQANLFHDNYMESPEDLEIQAQQLARFENPAVRVGINLGVKEATDLILKLCQAAGVLFDGSKKMSCEEIKKRHAEYLEQYVTKMQVFGNLGNISKEEYLDFYNQTGIDIDNRQEILIEALKYMEESIGKMVNFAKAIPGFSDLDIDDQVNLVKVSRFEFWVIKAPGSRGCRKSVYQVTTAPWDKEYHLEELQKLYPLGYLEQKHDIANAFLNLKLSSEETVLMKAIVLTFPDRCELKEPEKVEYLHNRLIACFLLMLVNRPPDKLITIQAVLGMLFRIRRLAAWDTQIIQEMFEVWPVSSKHQLVKEFVS